MQRRCSKQCLTPVYPALMAAQGLCPRNSSVELTSPFHRSRSVAVDRQFRALHRVRHAEHDGANWHGPAAADSRANIQLSLPSWPHKDFALDSTPSCDRCVQATETENSFRSQNELTRPPHKFPSGSIKQKTFAVATVRDFLGVRHTEHREKATNGEVNSARSEFGVEPSDGHPCHPRCAAGPPRTAYSRSVNTTDR